MAGQSQYTQGVASGLKSLRITSCGFVATESLPNPQPSLPIFEVAAEQAAHITLDDLTRNPAAVTGEQFIAVGQILVMVARVFRHL